MALAATMAVEAGERMSLAQAVEGIQAEFGISDTAMGLLPAAMIAVGVLGSVVVGILADRVRRTRLLGGAMVLWSVGLAGSAAAPGYNLLFASRLAVGAVEGHGPAAVSLLGDYYPVRKRGRMFGLYQGGALVGSVAGLVAGGIAVTLGGWRWAFWVWVPVGLAVAVWVWRNVEPARGHQDLDLSLAESSAGVGTGVTSIDAAEILDLPPPARVGTLDYRRAGIGAVVRELLQIPTMWLVLAALTISQFLLVGLQFWGVEFFKRAHDLSPGGAAAFTGIMGAGSAVGVLLGGYLSDRILSRGVVNARIFVVAVASLAAPVLLVPGFLIEDLWLTVPFFLLGGVLLTMPVAPGDAVLNDVVPAPLRGRASSVRSIVRSVGALSPLLIGVISDAIGLRGALAVIVPVYAVGGLVVLLAARTYPGDLSFVAAEARRFRAAGGGAAEDGAAGGGAAEDGVAGAVEGGVASAVDAAQGNGATGSGFGASVPGRGAVVTPSSGRGQDGSPSGL
jgi:MFS family permease